MTRIAAVRVRVRAGAALLDEAGVMVAEEARVYKEAAIKLAENKAQRRVYSILVIPKP